MNDNLIEMLLHLFEQSLTQLQENHQSIDKDDEDPISDEALLSSEYTELFIRAPHHESTRIISQDECFKLTKASYQFLMKMKRWNLIDAQRFETILEKLQQSDSRFVTLQETKWTIRSVLAHHFNEEQLSFLDLVLYPPKMDNTLH